MTTVQEYTPMAYRRQSPFSAPNDFELTGAGLTPRCTDDRKEAGVRCSEVLDDDKTGRDGMELELLPGCGEFRLARTTAVPWTAMTSRHTPRCACRLTAGGSAAPKASAAAAG